MVSTRLRAPLLLGAICLAWVALGAAQDPAPSGNENEKTLYANSQETFSPGFALGDVAIAEPEIADYKVLPGRREMLLYGKSPGATTLTLWDQKRVQRAAITITVISREDQQAEKDLTELVADFPSVKVRRVKGKLVVTGVVQTKNDLEAIEKIAETAEATSLVRLAGMVQPTSPGGTTTPAGPTEAPKVQRERRSVAAAGDDSLRVRRPRSQRELLERVVRDGRRARGPQPVQEVRRGRNGRECRALRAGLCDSAARQSHREAEEG